MNDDEDDDDLDGIEDEEFVVYEVDDDTRLLIETACNCIIALSEAQLQEESKIGLIAIADSLAERFAIDAVELIEHHHQTEDGEEVLLAPKGGVFPEADEPEEGEAPAETP
jgi:hypothetical protein